MHSKKELEQRLTEAGIYPLKDLGQNFLVNPRIVENIVKTVLKTKPSSIVEIGPGLGALTDDLLESKIPLSLVEVDSGLVRYWTKRSPTTKVIHQDALTLNWEDMLGSRPSVIVSNLPYAIAAPLMIELSCFKESFDDLIFMFQKEVAERIQSETGESDYGMLSVICQTRWTIKKVIDAGPQDFFPVPNVGSRVLHFSNRDVSVDMSLFLDFVKRAFAQRRKKLLSNLAQTFSVEHLRNAFQILDFQENARAQEISPAKFLELFQKLR